jgi:hypothetical protein
MGNQLVARHLITASGDCDDDGEVGGMNGFVRGNRSTRRKPAPTPPCPPQVPLVRPGREPGPPRREASVEEQILNIELILKIIIISYILISNLISLVIHYTCVKCTCPFTETNLMRQLENPES